MNDTRTKMAWKAWSQAVSFSAPFKGMCSLMKKVNEVRFSSEAGFVCTCVWVCMCAEIGYFFMRRRLMLLCHHFVIKMINHPPVCDMFVLPLLSCKGVPPFPDTEFGCTSYLVRNPTSGLLHPPTGKTRGGQQSTLRAHWPIRYRDQQEYSWSD